MNNWISVKDRMPELSCIIDVYVKDEYGNRRITNVAYRLPDLHNKKPYFDSFQHTDYGMQWIDITNIVTHWQPLPEPPQQ